MSEKEAHDLCIGKAFNQRRVYRRELAALEKTAQGWGEWLSTIADRLAGRESYYVEEEQGRLVFLTPSESIRHRVDDGPSETLHVPTTTELAHTFNRLTELRAKIAELDIILHE
jgi:hypothetical protein